MIDACSSSGCPLLCCVCSGGVWHSGCVEARGDIRPCRTVRRCGGRSFPSKCARPFVALSPLWPLSVRSHTDAAHYAPHRTASHRSSSTRKRLPYRALSRPHTHCPLVSKLVRPHRVSTSSRCQAVSVAACEKAPWLRMLPSYRINRSARACSTLHAAPTLPHAGSSTVRARCTHYLVSELLYGFQPVSTCESSAASNQAKAHAVSLLPSPALSSATLPSVRPSVRPSR